MISFIKKNLGLFLILLSPLLLSATPLNKSGCKICLNMIVKDENPIILRCLASVKPLIDSWVIVDTGSTDGTQEAIINFLNDLPGKLYERPWVNFSHNRNEALELATGQADYILFIDADEILQFSSDFSLPILDKDYYYIITEYSGTRYGRVQLVKSSLNWKWEGVLHESVASNQAHSIGTLEKVACVVNTDGNRSKDPLKYEKDALVLEKALLDDPTNSRYVFYLAQSYRDSQQYEKALESYNKRTSMGGWNEEVFWSLLQIGLIQEALKMPSDIIVKSYYKAFSHRPHRIEPLYRIANFYRRAENYFEAYKAARKGIHIRSSNDNLFVEQWIYDYGLLLEFSISAYWTENYFEALLASYLLLSNPSLPSHIKECVQKNLKWIEEKVQVSAILSPSF